MPTPGVAFLTRALRLSAGIMVSASHNPFEDNGIKFFSGEGTKLPDAVEHEIEAELERPLATRESAELGKAERVHDAEGRYIEFCKGTFAKHRTLRGVKLVVDCAHGAGYRVGPRVFQELGAEVVAIGAHPNGTNINHGCGATHAVTMARAVVEHGADFGIAFDGDGDRLAMADHDGRLFDGDQLLYAIAKHRHEQGRLRGGVAGTLMTNFALERRLGELGIPFARARVGDRYVVEMLHEKGWECGGENSGHILCLDRTSTGDALVSALQVLAVMRRTGQPLAQLAAGMHKFPQVMLNVRVAQRFDPMSVPAVAKVVAGVEQSLGGDGRVVLRASGTEPLIRVMVEGRDEETTARCAAVIADAVKAAAGA